MRKQFKKKYNQKKYSKRAHSAESPFGQVKHNLKFRFFMRRGADKINMECGLLFSLHNLNSSNKPSAPIRGSVITAGDVSDP